MWETHVNIYLINPLMPHGLIWDHVVSWATTSGPYKDTVLSSITFNRNRLYGDHKVTECEHCFNNFGLIFVSNIACLSLLNIKQIIVTKSVRKPDEKPQ